MATLRRIYRLPPELEETLVADLWLAGTLGVATEPEADGSLRLTAYFAPPPVHAEAPDGQTRPPLAPAPQPPASAARPPIECLAEDELPDTDWMAEYRRLSRPFPLGRTLWVDPREPEEPGAAGEAGEAEADEAGAADAGDVAVAPAGRRLLRLPARTAFGTGSHESTALAIELLEAAEPVGRAILDAGTGTGVLAFAALAWGASRAVAFDVDPVAAFQARANSRLNRLYPRLFAGRPAALAPRLPAAARFDLAVVNVVPEQILPEIEKLVSALRPGGALILSGLLTERAPAALATLAALGLFEADRRSKGEWVALRLEPRPS
jgi:ribosomal protein L11 methyltransferase